MNKTTRKFLSLFLLLILFNGLYFVIPTKLLYASYGSLVAPSDFLSTFGLMISIVIWIAALHVSTKWILKKVGYDVEQEKLNTTRGQDEMDI